MKSCNSDKSNSVKSLEKVIVKHNRWTFLSYCLIGTRRSRALTVHMKK